MGTLAIQIILGLIGVVLVVASVWSIRKHPKYFLVGGAVGAVLLTLLWGAMGTLAVLFTAKPDDQHNMAELTAPAWPLFIDILWRAAVLGAMLGGVSLTLLLADFGDEASEEEAGKEGVPNAKRPAKAKAK